MFREVGRGPAIDGEALEARLRKCFTSEVAAERAKVPNPNYILLMAKIDALNRKRSKVTAIESGSEILVLGSIATVLAGWWNEAIAALEAILPIASEGVSSATVLGVLTALLTVLLFWTRTMVWRP